MNNGLRRRVRSLSLLTLEFYFGDPMALIREEDATEIRQRLKAMADPVKLVHFTQELNIEYGRETRQLLEELATLSDKLSLEVYDFLLDDQKVAEYGVDKVPATAVRNGKDYGIRFYGIPAGYEFAALLDAIIEVSLGTSELSAETKEKLSQVTQSVHLQVFVTPT
jgi:glutaredoxin-like protein